MSIDALPEENSEQLFQRMLKQMKEDPKKGIKNVLKGYVPERYFLFLLEKMKLMAASKLDKFLMRRFVHL